MPLDTTPRSLPFSIFLPPGRVDLCRATGTRSPAWMFQAPVTIWMGALWPTSSWQIHMWSESGWRSMVRMRAHHHIGDLGSQVLGDLHLGAGEGHGLGKVFIVGVDVHKLVQPLSAQ